MVYVKNSNAVVSSCCFGVSLVWWVCKAMYVLHIGVFPFLLFSVLFVLLCTNKRVRNCFNLNWGRRTSLYSFWVVLAKYVLCMHTDCYPSVRSIILTPPLDSTTLVSWKTAMIWRPKKERTKKRGNCECIATWGRPSQASPFPL